MYPISGKKKRRDNVSKFLFFFFEKVQIPKFTAKGDNVSKILSKNKIDGASPKKEKNNLLKKRKRKILFLKWKLRVLMSLIRESNPIGFKY